MPIIKSGYRSDKDKGDLQRFYSSPGWKQARAVVLERAGGRCEFCGGAPEGGRPLDVVHLTRSTLELLRAGGDALDPARLAAGHRRCHSAFSSGKIGPPVL
jgi:hypothetical protein